ncbi:MAG: DUF4397 domain-containing protein [Aeromonas sp.]
MKWNKLAATLALGLAMSACFDSDEDDNDTSAGTAQVRVTHLSGDAPKVNIVADGAAYLNDLAFGSTSGLAPIAPDSYLVRADAQLPDGTVTTVIPAAELALEADTVYDVIALGNVADSGDTALQPLVLERPAIGPGVGEIRLQVLHAAPAVPAVDIYLTAPEAALTTPTFAAVAFKGFSDATVLAAGEYRVRITLAGSTEVEFDSGPLPLAEGADLLIAAVENYGSGPSSVRLLPIGKEAAAPITPILSTDEQVELRVIHAVPDAPAVDVLASGVAVPAFSNLAFGNVKGYAELAAASYDFAIAPTGTTTEVLALPGAALVAGNSYTVLAVGELASIGPLLLTDNPQPLATAGQVRVVHAVPTVGLVDVYATIDGDISAATPLLSGVAFKASSAYLPVPLGSYILTVTAAGDKAAVIESALPVIFEASSVKTVVALGGVAPSLLVIDDIN